MSVANLIRQSTWANLPSAASESGLGWIVTDANSLSNPTSGGTPGNLVLVYSNGSTWAPAPSPLNAISTITSSANIPASYLPSTFIIDATAGAVTATLPSPSAYPGQIVYCKKKDNVNLVTISANGINIDGSTLTFLTTQYQSLTFQSDGTQWWII